MRRTSGVCLLQVKMLAEVDIKHPHLALSTDLRDLETSEDRRCKERHRRGS